MHFAFPQLLTAADLESATAKEPVHEETTRESLLLLRTSCPAGSSGPIALPRAPQLLIPSPHLVGTSSHVEHPWPAGPLPLDVSIPP
jgi:hypothetical protein